MCQKYFWLIVTTLNTQASLDFCVQMFFTVIREYLNGYLNKILTVFQDKFVGGNFFCESPSFCGISVYREDDSWWRIYEHCPLHHLIYSILLLVVYIWGAV